MSKENYLDRLLDGELVEWRELGDERFFEIANSARKPVKASLRKTGDIPYYGANNIQDYVQGYTHDGEFVLIAEDGSASLESYSIQYAVGKFWANNHIHVICGKGGISTRFLYHYLAVVNFVPFLTGGVRAKLTKGSMVDIKIPIPPLAIQAKIVRILDTFTELTKELTKELTLRQKQYAYYREKLLSFEAGAVEWLALGEVTQYEQPTKYLVGSKDYSDEFDTPVLTAGKTFILGYTDEVDGIYKASNAPVIIFDDFTTSNKWVNFDFKVKSSAMKMILSRDESKVLLKYIYYWLNTFPSKLIDSEHKRQWIGTVATKKIPIPPLAEQVRIVSILDKFDTLTTSITEGLPREIELRQKQYAYYRDLLLGFPKPEEARATPAPAGWL